MGQAGELGVKAGEGDGGSFAFGKHTTEEHGWRFPEARVEQEQARELGACVAGDAGDGGAEGRVGGRGGHSGF